MDTKVLKSLEVGLNPGTSGRITPPDRQGGETAPCFRHH